MSTQAGKSKAAKAKNAKSKPKKTAKQSQGQISVRSSTKRIKEPAAFSTIRTVKAPDRKHTETFTDFFQTVSTGSQTFSGETMCNAVTNIPAFGLRIATLASLYQRWRVRKLVFRYVTNVGTGEPGSLTMAHVSDATWTAPGALNLVTGTPTTNQLIMMLNETEGAKTFPVWAPEVIMKVPAKKEWLYCNNLNVAGMVANMTAAGVFILVANGLLAVSKTYGRVYVDAVVDFKDTDYNLVPIAAVLANNVVNSNAVTAAPLQLALSNASGINIAAPFVVWLPSANFSLSSSPTINAYKNLPLFLALNPASGFYGVYNSPFDFQTGTPLSGTTSGLALGSAETFYYPPN